MTKLAEQDSTNINKIVERWVKRGVVPVRGQEPHYGDFTASLDFHSALSRVRAAEAEFMNLPSHVRKYVDNDPGKFLDLVMSPEGRRELEELGMVSDFAPPGAPEPAAPVASPEEEAPTPSSEPS